MGATLPATTNTWICSRVGATAPKACGHECGSPNQRVSQASEGNGCPDFLRRADATIEISESTQL
eukprot:12749648-Prorocentrum_lima.AAC.1